MAADGNKIHVTADKATYLATLYGKAMDANAADSILSDTYAADAVARIHFDWKSLKLPSGSDISLPLRALFFDNWTREFIDANPVCTVLHLGCGLDTRVLRINPGPTVRWYDVDLPDVIALREQLYPRRVGYHMIGASVTELAWLDAIPGDMPVCVVAEGLMMYLPEQDGTALLRRVTEQFPSGQVMFDAYSAWMTRLVSRLATVRGAKVGLVWGIGDPSEIEKRVPKLHLIESVEFLALPELDRRLSTNAFLKAVYGLTGKIGFFRRLVLHLKYGF